MVSVFINYFDFKLDSDAKYDQNILKEVKILEKEGVKLAEAGEFQKSLKCFDDAISLLPDRGSAYNNRAQSKRLTGNVDGTLNFIFMISL